MNSDDEMYTVFIDRFYLQNELVIMEWRDQDYL